MKWVSLGAWLFATIMGFVYPDAEQTIGEAQRLFYIHFGTYYTAFGLFIVGVVSGAAYLRTHHVYWDNLQCACLEIGLWFLTITIVTGMFVARPVWGVFWTWDTRLVTVAILWLTYMAYFFLRGSIDSPDTRRRFAAVYAILAFAAVVLSMWSLQEATNLTSPVLDFTSLSLGMSPRIGLTIWVNLVAYALVAGTLVSFLVKLARRRQAVDIRKWQVLT
jgi:heme exporter protein C